MLAGNTKYKVGTKVILCNLDDGVEHLNGVLAKLTHPYAFSNLPLGAYIEQTLTCQTSPDHLNIGLNDFILYDDEWIATDPDKGQWVKPLSVSKFLVINNGTLHNINLVDYSESKIRDYIVGYYDSLEELKEIYGEDANQIIAECIAEQS